MKLFYLEQKTEPEIIGFYPQTRRTKNKGYHVDAYNSERKVSRDAFPEFNPRYGLELHPKSITTDVLDKSTLPFGYVVSERFKEILENHNLPPHRFYNIDVFGTSDTFYWFHSITNISKFIDFEKTEIEVFNVIKQVVLETIKGLTFEKIKKMKRETVLKRGIALRFKSIALNNDFPNYDIFQIDGAQYFTLISEKLKQKLEEENITGIGLKEYSKIKLGLKST